MSAYHGMCVVETHFTDPNDESIIVALPLQSEEWYSTQATQQHHSNAWLPSAESQTRFECAATLIHLNLQYLL